jgi:hypothetical protein
VGKWALEIMAPGLCAIGHLGSGKGRSKNCLHLSGCGVGERMDSVQDLFAAGSHFLRRYVFERADIPCMLQREHIMEFMTLAMGTWRGFIGRLGCTTIRSGLGSGSKGIQSIMNSLHECQVLETFLSRIPKVDMGGYLEFEEQATLLSDVLEF